MTSASTRARPRVLVVIGTRPEGIKLAPVVSALSARADEVEVEVVLTGQHTDLMDQVLEVFALRVDPSRDLGIMREGQDLYDVAHGCLDGLRDVVRDYRPELVLVQGDTATVFLASLVAFFERTRVGHVEAGLRSHDKWRPYPEEIFRRLTGVIADVHFAPTPRARDNLLREGVPADLIHVTGNTVVDALTRIAAHPREPRNAELRQTVDEVRQGRRLVLLTAHRRESFGEPMREAFRAVREVADRFDDIIVLYPVHPNPNVRAAADEVLRNHPRIRLTTPLDYLDLVAALRESTLIITDSGGIQEEAPTFGKPVLVLREVTERPEGVEAGIAATAGTDSRKIVNLATDVLRGGWQALRGTSSGYEKERSSSGAVREQLKGPRRNTSPPLEQVISEDLASGRVEQVQIRAFPNPYGDGNAAERIAQIVVDVVHGRRPAVPDWEPPRLAHREPA